MKLSSSARNTTASILLASLFMMLIVAAALACYLTLVTNQNQLTYRSQTWNCAMALVESGLEEGLNHCSYNSSNLASFGWALSSGRHTKSNWVGTGYYIASISTNAPYDIISSGYYPMPGGTRYVSRSVRVTTTLAPKFVGAMVSKGTVDLNGNGVFIDSYDSSDPAKSTNGHYDPAKRGDKADIYLATTGTAFSTGNGNVYGKAYTGPDVTVTTGPNGAVGSAAWNASSSGVQPGWWINTASVTVPDVAEPFTAATPPTSGVVGGTTYDYVLVNGNYMMATLDKKCAVTGDATIYVTDSINSSVLTILSNASVKIYSAAASAGFNTVNNYGTAISLQYFGLPSNTSLSLGGDWIGGVYAPSADFSIEGNNDISGAVVAKSIRMRGTSAFHYDQALNCTNLPSGFIITSWNEL